jgi:hypothetical protein
LAALGVRGRFHGYDGAFAVSSLARAILASIISPQPAVGRPAGGRLGRDSASQADRQDFFLFFFKKTVASVQIIR